MQASAENTSVEIAARAVVASNKAREMMAKYAERAAALRQESGQTGSPVPSGNAIDARKNSTAQGIQERTTLKHLVLHVLPHGWAQRDTSPEHLCFTSHAEPHPLYFNAGAHLSFEYVFRQDSRCIPKRFC